MTLTLFKTFKDNFTKNIEIVSTNKKAIEWILNEPFDGDINEIIKKLSNNL